MKRFVQLAAILVIGLLAFQPALAGLHCLLGARASCVPDCPMASNSMGPNCPMSQQMAASDCPRNCCSQSLPQAFTLSAAPEKSHPGALVSLQAVAFATPAMMVSPAIQVAGIDQSLPPPIYLLNRVLRI
jgi:hypothetical protein